MNYMVPEWQRRLHIVTEAAAVLMVPLLFAAAAEAKEPHKTFLRGLAVGTVVVDGLLLYQWVKKNRGYL